MWDDQFDEFARQYRVIRFDVRNHGLSKGIPDTFPHYEDLRKLFDHLGLDKAAVLGLSLGGRIAIDFDIVHPDRVSAMVLAAPGTSGFQFTSEVSKRNNERMQKAFSEGDIDTAIEYFQRSWTDGPSREPDEVDPTVREKVRCLALGTIRGWESQSVMTELDPPAIDRLGKIRTPTLAVMGDLDMPGIHTIVDRIMRNVPGAEEVVIPGTAHMLNMEKPEEFNRAVLDFLSRIIKKSRKIRDCP
jgi:3-oxoadipate enol-lactonase